MEISVKEAADLVGGEIFGDASISFSRIARIDEAQPGDLTFLYLSQYEKYFSTTKASVIIVKPTFEKNREDITYIVTENPHEAVLKLILKYFTPEIKFKGIDPSAQISPKAKLGENVTIGKNVVISEGCEIGDGSIVLHNTVLMENVKIGNDCLIYPNVTIREECRLGNRVIIHSGTVIGSDGFGFAPDDKGVYRKIPQIGTVEIGDDVELGANVTVDRAAIGVTRIGNGVKVDNLVQIAHNVSVGDHTVMSAQSGISGSTKVGKHTVIAGQVGIAGHLELADGVIIGAQSGVSKSLTKPGKYFGYPAKEWGTSLRLEGHIRNLPEYSKRIKELEKRISELEKKLNQGE
jgi:UDP-3-O-[3-hydroxymyristoyl] glucosamine N-acyltransferase